MYCAEPQLLKTYASAPAKVTLLVDNYASTRKTSGKMDPVPSIDSAVTYLFIAGDQDIRLSEEAARGILDITGLLDSQFNKNHKFFRQGTHAPLLRKLAGRWICNAQFDSKTTNYTVVAASLLNINEVLPVALKLCKSDVPGIDKTGAIFAVARLGGVQYIKQIEPLLSESKVLFESEEINGEVTIRLCDVALAMLIQLTNQKMKNYGIDDVDRDSFNLKTAMRIIVPLQAFFSNSAKRDQAISTGTHGENKTQILRPRKQTFRRKTQTNSV